MEQYRQMVDEVLAGAGIDWRGGLRSEADAQKLARWAAGNANHPLAKYIASRGGNIYEGLAQLRGASTGLKTGAEPPRFREAFGIPAEGAEQAPAAPTGPDPRKQYLDWITRFTQEMGRPAGPGDPTFDSLTRMGAARASMNVGAQGVRVGRGGLGEAAIQQGANAAVMPYEMQRKQLQAQGLGMLDQAQRGWEGLDQNAHLLNQNITRMNNDAMAQAWAQSQNQNQATGATAGGLLGLLGGGIATIATGGAAAPLIPGLMTGGSQIGAGIAGNSGPSYRPQQYRPYTPNSSWY